MSEITPTTNDIVIPQVEGTVHRDEATLAKLAKANSWLARFQLLQFSADLVKQRKGIGGTYVAVYDKDTIEQLTDGAKVLTFEAILYDWRAKALRLVNKVPEQQSYDFDSPEFKAIKEESERLPKNSPIAALWGPEFLYWIPKAKNGAGAFLTFFCSSKTARREADNIRTYLGKTCLMEAKFIETTQYSWHGPKILPCTSIVRMPTPEDLTEALHKFRNPPKDVKELAEAEAAVEQ